MKCRSSIHETVLILHSKISLWLLTSLLSFCFDNKNERVQNNRGMIKFEIKDRIIFQRSSLSIFPKWLKQRSLKHESRKNSVNIRVNFTRYCTQITRAQQIRKFFMYQTHPITKYSSRSKFSFKIVRKSEFTSAFNLSGAIIKTAIKCKNYISTYVSSTFFRYYDSNN